MWLLACTPEPLLLTVSPHYGGVHLEGSRPFEAAQVRALDGTIVYKKHLPAPSSSLDLIDVLPSGSWILEIESKGVWSSFDVTLPESLPLRVELQPAPGSPWLETLPEQLEIPHLIGSTTEVLLGLTGSQPLPALPPISLDMVPVSLALQAPGKRETLAIPVADQPVLLQVGNQKILLVPVLLQESDISDSLELLSLEFPASADGTPEPARPAFQVLLPPPLPAFLQPPRQDMEAPYSYLSVTLANHSDRPLDLSLGLVINDPAFAPRLRAADGGSDRVAALIRIPPHQSSTASLPVFVDDSKASPGEVAFHLNLTPLGSNTPILSWDRAFLVRVANPLALPGALGILGLCVGTAVWVTRRLSGWLASPTRDLTLIALIGSILFVAGSAADLVSTSLAALLGPFSTLLTGLLSDVVRITLLGTLLGLRPIPGTLALCMLSGQILRVLATGAFSPIDLVYLFNSIGIHEALAFCVGLSRNPDWLSGSQLSRWLRLSLAFAPAGALTALIGLWIHGVLYRLYFAGWYILLQAGVTGALYAVMASWIAARLATALRKVSP